VGGGVGTGVTVDHCASLEDNLSLGGIYTVGQSGVYDVVSVAPSGRMTVTEVAKVSEFASTSSE
jgi:hypothetical protein